MSIYNRSTLTGLFSSGFCAYYHQRHYGQLLNYYRELSESGKLLDSKKSSTFFDISTAKTIEYFKLPIEYIYFTYVGAVS